MQLSINWKRAGGLGRSLIAQSRMRIVSIWFVLKLINKSVNKSISKFSNDFCFWKEKSQKEPSIKDVGTFFLGFDKPLPHVCIFSLLSIGKLSKHFDPSPLQIAYVFYGRPQNKNEIRTTHCTVCDEQRLRWWKCPHKSWWNGQLIPL